MKLISIVIPYIETSQELTLFCQVRNEDGALNGLWEFPGGKIESGELPKDSALREFKEEVGIELSPKELELFSNYQYSYEDRDLLFYIFKYDASGNLDLQRALEPQKIPWENAQNVVQEASIPDANKEFLLEFISFIRVQKG